MRNTIGFSITDEIEETGSRLADSFPVSETEDRAVPCVVSVEFEDEGRPLNYYNDRFNLSVGDKVYVEGKYAGQLGTVTKVSTCFKIRLSDYRRVIARPRFAPRGTFEQAAGMFVSYGNNTAMTESFLELAIPPAKEDAEDFVLGEGFRVGIFSSADGDDVDSKIVERGIGYVTDRKVIFISVINGKGKAVIAGSENYELDFTLAGNVIEEAYCSCPCPGVCKHAVATALQLNALLGEMPEDAVDRGFTAIESELFMKLAMNAGKITLD